MPKKSVKYFPRGKRPCVTCHNTCCLSMSRLPRGVVTHYGVSSHLWPLSCALHTSPPTECLQSSRLTPDDSKLGKGSPRRESRALHPPPAECQGKLTCSGSGSAEDKRISPNPRGNTHPRTEEEIGRSIAESSPSALTDRNLAFSSWL